MWRNKTTLSSELEAYGISLAREWPLVAQNEFGYHLDKVGCMVLEPSKANEVLGGSEEPSAGVLFCSSNSCEVMGVVLTGTSPEGNTWHQKAKSCAAIAEDLLGELPRRLGCDHAHEPLFVFDMSATIFQSAIAAASASGEKLVIVFSSGKGKDSTATRFVILSLDKYTRSAGHISLEAA